MKMQKQSSLICSDLVRPNLCSWFGVLEEDTRGLGVVNYTLVMIMPFLSVITGFRVY